MQPSPRNPRGGKGAATAKLVGVSNHALCEKGSAIGRKPTTEKVKIVFSKWSLVGQLRTFTSYAQRTASRVNSY
jgi:hypothetical protein